MNTLYLNDSKRYAYECATCQKAQQQHLSRSPALAVPNEVLGDACRVPED
jgi:hypothetical protein